MFNFRTGEEIQEEIDDNQSYDEDDDDDDDDADEDDDDDDADDGDDDEEVQPVEEKEKKKKKLLPNSALKVCTKVTYEPWHEKNNKVSVHPAKAQISLDIRPVWAESSLSAWRNFGSLATH